MTTLAGRHGVMACCLLAKFLGGVSGAGAQTFPDPAALPSRPDLHDPLTMLDGRKVRTREQWFQERRPELKNLFQFYMYGYLPPAPGIHATVGRTFDDVLGGKAALKEVSIDLGAVGRPRINLLVLSPRRRNKRSPVILGLNFCGNHAVIPDPRVALPTGWLPAECPGTSDNKATEAGRGLDSGWSVEQVIERGYALAVFYHGDVAPDLPDFTRGIFPFYMKPGQSSPGPHDWGAIAAWAWGMQRAVDYLVTDKAIDGKRIVAFGHSRNGKAAILAAAFDERIALALPHQAGRGGTAPSRSTAGESVKAINDRFPHWFNETFPLFNDDPSRLPFDQHELIALMAPRPVLLTNAVEDAWADPAGQFRVLRAADGVYRFLGAGGLATDHMPPPGRLIDGRLGYYIRPGNHSTTPEDWRVFLDFADKQMKSR